MEIWGRTDSAQFGMGDYWIFASENPFAATYNPSTMASRPDVLHLHQAGAPNPSSVIVTRGPDGGLFRARYVRIQLNTANYLSLSEVKVLGSTLAPYSGIRSRTHAQGPKASRDFSARDRIRTFPDAQGRGVDALARASGISP